MPSRLALQARVFFKRRELERSCRWTADRLARHQQEQAAALRRFALERSPFYARFHKGMENRLLADLPILSKAVLMENFEDVVTDRSIRLPDVEAHLKKDSGDGFYLGRYVVLSTSGSTGLRGVFLFDDREWLECLSSIARPMKWAGVAPSPFRKIPTAMLASATPWHYSARIGRALENGMMPTLRFDAGEPAETMVKKLNGWQPEVLVAYPSVLKQLADEQLAGRLHIAPRVCAASAEVLSQETRRRVHEAWKVRIWETYGATEYAPIAAECEAGNRHLFEDGAIIENVDSRGRPVPPGELGDRVLLTVFSRRTQPLIRYEISDMLRLSDKPCGCGRPFRTMAEIEGRREDVLYLHSAPGGKEIPIHPNLFHELLETVPATGWQVVHDPGGLTVNLTGLRDQAAPLAIERGMARMLESQGAAVPPIRVTAVPELRRGRTGKAPLVLRSVPEE